MKSSFKDILEGVERDTRARLGAKLPDWAGADPEIPSRLSLEQCSSSAAAAFKASLAADIIGKNGRIADLTGGLGADSYAFSRVSEAVWYNERDAALSEVVSRNFNKLGVCNVSFNNFDIAASSDTWQEELQKFTPDLIYLDPARRSAAGKKVFLLEDCSPDIAALHKRLLDITPTLMVKLSPMADITMVCRRLDGCVSDIYIVGLDGECKELLCILKKGFCGEAVIHVQELGRGGLSFTMTEEAESAARYPSSEEELKGVLLEPLPSLMKSGARKLLCEKFSLVKLAPPTQLYLSDEADSPLESGLFKAWKIIDIAGIDKTSCRSISSKYPAAGVSARGIPLSSDQLRSRLGIRKEGNNFHIFGAGVSIGGKECRRMLVTRKSNKE